MLIQGVRNHPDKDEGLGWRIELLRPNDLAAVADKIAIGDYGTYLVRRFVSTNIYLLTSVTVGGGLSKRRYP